MRNLTAQHAAHRPPLPPDAAQRPVRRAGHRLRHRRTHDGRAAVRARLARRRARAALHGGRRHAQLRAQRLRVGRRRALHRRHGRDDDVAPADGLPHARASSRGRRWTRTTTGSSSATASTTPSPAREAFRDNLVGHFPREAAAIDRYLELLREVSRGMRTFSLDRTLPPWAAAIAGPFLRRRLPRSFRRTTWEVLSEITHDPELIAVLTGQWGDLGLPPKRSSFVVQALIARHYLHGGFYPVGGAWRIAETILPRIRAAGGEVFTYARVEEVLLRPAACARCAACAWRTAARSLSDCVISDAGAINTFTHLLPGAGAPRARLRPPAHDREAEHRPPRRLHRPQGHGRGTRPAEDQLLDLSAATTTTARSTASSRIRTARSPSCTSRFPRRRTRTSSGVTRDARRSRSWRRHPTRSSSPGRTATWGKRGDDYDALKQSYGERLLEHLYDKVPQVRGRIDYWEVSTPLSMQ